MLKALKHNTYIVLLIDNMNTDTAATVTTVLKFSENEYINYQKEEGKKFETPELEHEWALTQYKILPSVTALNHYPITCSIPQEDIG